MLALGWSLVIACVPQDAPSDFATRVAGMVQRVDPQRLRRTIDDLVAFGTRHMASSTDDPARGTGAARDYLEAQLRASIPASEGRLTVARETHRGSSSRLAADTELVNIVATLRGTTDPDRIYVVGGHYDSINKDPKNATDDAPGANDDGSGTALVVEACRVLSSESLAATVVFVCYDGEEMGLLGSAAHAEALSAASAEVDGMITDDIVGNTLGMDGQRRTDYLRCFSYAPRGNDSSGRSLARAATRAAQNVPGFRVMLVNRGDRYGRGGDHRPFAQAGYPSVRFTEAREDFSRQHQNVTTRDGAPYGDLPAFVDTDYLAQVCCVNIAMLAELAMAPRAPGRVRAEGARDAYDTLITFDSVEGAADYEAVWRLTTSPDWEGARLVGESVEKVGDVVRARLAGICLDDMVVGVRSVGADGSRSRVSTPPEPDAFDQRPARREPR